MNTQEVAYKIVKTLIDDGFAQRSFAGTVQSIVKDILDEHCPKTEMNEQRAREILRENYIIFKNRTIKCRGRGLVWMPGWEVAGLNVGDATADELRAIAFWITAHQGEE